jgi:hypothetical protein
VLKIRSSQEQRKYWGFDSFKGLPEPITEELGVFHEGQFDYEMTQVNKNLTKNKVDLTKIKLVPGFYEESLSDELRNQLVSENFKVSVLYLDCDLYESTLCVLNFIEEFLQSGTVICFDDWYSYGAHKDKGQPRAVVEFLQNHPGVKFDEWVNSGISHVSKGWKWLQKKNNE